MWLVCYDKGTRNGGQLCQQLGIDQKSAARMFRTFYYVQSNIEDWDSYGYRLRTKPLFFPLLPEKVLDLLLRGSPSSRL